MTLSRAFNVTSHIVGKKTASVLDVLQRNAMAMAQAPLAR